MPYYPKLKFHPKDKAEDKVRKRRVIKKLEVLREALQGHFAATPAQHVANRTTKVATWNLREFGKKNYGGRSFEDLYYIAEIISNFDLVALQEIRSDLSELEELLRILGPQWEYIATDVTDGRPGNDERMVFLYNQDVAQFRNIAGELTLKENQRESICLPQTFPL